MKHGLLLRTALASALHDGAQQLYIEVRDDGVGGARGDGPGLIGLADRLAALDGRLGVDSPPGEGTLIAATLPLRV